MAILEAFNALIDELGLSQSELASRTQLNPSNVSRFLRGTLNSRRSTVQRIAKELEQVAEAKGLGVTKSRADFKEQMAYLNIDLSLEAAQEQPGLNLSATYGDGLPLDQLLPIHVRSRVARYDDYVYGCSNASARVLEDALEYKRRVSLTRWSDTPDGKRVQCLLLLGAVFAAIECVEKLEFGKYIDMIHEARTLIRSLDKFPNIESQRLEARIHLAFGTFTRHLRGSLAFRPESTALKQLLEECLEGYDPRNDFDNPALDAALKFGDFECQLFACEELVKENSRPGGNRAIAQGRLQAAKEIISKSNLSPIFKAIMAVGIYEGYARGLIHRHGNLKEAERHLNLASEWQGGVPIGACQIGLSMCELRLQQAHASRKAGQHVLQGIFAPSVAQLARKANVEAMYSAA